MSCHDPCPTCIYTSSLHICFFALFLASFPLYGWFGRGNAHCDIGQVDEVERILYDRCMRKRPAMVCTLQERGFITRFCTRRIMGKENTAWDFFFGFDF